LPKIAEYAPDTVLDDADIVLGQDAATGETKTFTGATIREGLATAAELDDHLANVSNPHAVTKAQVGLSSVPNLDATDRTNHTGTQPSSSISDFNTATDARITAKRGVASGVASLDAGGLVPVSQLPALVSSSTYTVANQAAMLALAANKGDFAIRTDSGNTYILAALPASTLANWVQVVAGGGGGTGDMVLASVQTNTGKKTFDRGTFADKGSLVFDVTAYGAIGDGATDCYAAVAAALADIASVYSVLNTSATLYFPGGEYLMSAPLVAISRLHIRGAGRGATKITKNFNTTPLVDISGSGTSNDGSTHIREVSVHDIKLEGNSTTGPLLRTYYASEIYFHNVLFVGSTGRGLDAVELFDSYFSHCAWEDFFSTTEPVIHLRSSMASSGFGNGVDSVNMVWFTDCRIESFKSTAIKIGEGLGAGVDGAPNGFYFKHFKIECSNVRGTLIDFCR
jgi:hypothetical protein